MNDHNLDDLIIDNIEPKNTKTKSFLTIVALLIVVLIIAIILTKIILKDPNADKIAFEENNTELVSPELTLQSAAEPEPAKKEPELSNIIENALKSPAPIEEVAKETVEITKEVVQVPKQPEVKTEAEEEKLQQEYAEIRKARVEKEKAEAEAKKAKAEDETKRAEMKKEELKKAEMKKEVAEAAKPVPAQIIEKAKVRPTGKPVNVPAPKPVTAQTYYIQVGSFTQTPSARFLSIIKNSGFDYKITPPTSSGTKKLLIGPYKDRKSVDTALVRVRDRINKSAFVVKK
jgi:DedD protein